MFQRRSLMTGLTLGVGVLLGYAAAWGLPIPGTARAQQPPAVAVTEKANECCATPARAEVFTSFQGAGGPAPKGGGNPRGATTGPTDAKGYDHPNQFLHVKPVQFAPNMEPTIINPGQVDDAIAKLTKAQAKFGRKPNFLVFLMDDVGWMDPGFNGGGVTVGNPTPNMDKFARQGLVLRSAY